MAKRYEEPFINKFGHKIEVGDKVVAVVQGYNHSIKSYQGVYIGYVKSEWYGKESKKAQVRTFHNNNWGYRGGITANQRIATLQSNLIFPEPKEVQYADL